MAHSASGSGAAKQCFHVLDGKSLRSNVIIYEACISGDNKFYKISFLDKLAQEGKQQWISEDAMNKIITHNLKKVKYVFDKTTSCRRSMTLPTMPNPAAGERDDLTETYKYDEVTKIVTKT